MPEQVLPSMATPVDAEMGCKLSMLLQAINGRFWQSLALAQVSSPLKLARVRGVAPLPRRTRTG